MILEEFNTCQCHVVVYDTGLSYNNEKIYCLTSFHLCSEKEITRFGDRTQVKVMANSYRNKSKIVKYREW